MKRFFAFVLFVVLPICTVAFILIYSPLFRINTIDITGQIHETTKNILDTSDLEIGCHPFFPLQLLPGNRPLLHIEASRAKIEKLAWVKTAKVDWIPLHTLRIQVTERIPFAKLPYLQGFLVIDDTGVVLYYTDKMSDEKEIRGIRFSGYIMGRKPDTENPKNIDLALQVLKTIQQTKGEGNQNLIDFVDWVDIVADNRALVLLDQRITVRFDPNTELQYTIDFMKSIFFQHIAPEEKGVLDFTRGGNPSFRPD